MTCAPSEHSFIAHPWLCRIFCTRCGTVMPCSPVGGSSKRVSAAGESTRSTPTATDAEENVEIDPDLLALNLVKQAGYDPEAPFIDQAKDIITEALRTKMGMEDREDQRGDLPVDLEAIELDGQAYEPRRVKVNNPEDDDLPSAGL